jgi:hypothetical protein
MKRLLFAFLLVLGVGPPTAHADLIINGFTEADFGLVSVSSAGVVITGAIGDPIQSLFTDGAGSGVVDGGGMINSPTSPTLGVGDSMNLSSLISGTAPSSPTSSVDALYGLTASLTMNNSSASSANVLLRMDFDVSAETGGPDAPPSLGFANSELLVFLDDVDLFERFMASNTASGGGLMSDSGTRDFLIPLEAGQTRRIDIELFSNGFAETIAVPEAGQFAYLSFVSIFLILRRVRRKDVETEPVEFLSPC